MHLFLSGHKSPFIRLLSLLLFALLASCSTSGTDVNSAKPSSFSFSAVSNGWPGDSSKYRELANGPLSGELGSSLSRAAIKQALEAEYNALEKSKPGEVVDWRYSDSQTGKIIPYSPYRVGSSNCRRYIHSVSIEGTTRQATGTACRDNSGVWTPLT
ncbi:MAG: hypothetical protein L3J32_06050 [Rhizobiaceae bacterium]|nr:hypothetical protein [Rhizobiaceae bacterium]